jgi:hypothetical protein
MCIIFTIFTDKATLSELQPTVHYSAGFVIWLLLMGLPQLLRSKVITYSEFRISLKGKDEQLFSVGDVSLL